MATKNGDDACKFEVFYTNEDDGVHVACLNREHNWERNAGYSFEALAKHVEEHRAEIGKRS